MDNLEFLVRKWGALELVWPDHTSASAALGRTPALHERNFWRKLIRKTYGVLALKAGYALFGRALTLTDLAHIAKAPEAWAQRAKEGAGLAPLLAPFVKVLQSAPADYKKLRESALARGLASSSWKWLCHQKPETVAKLFSFGWTNEAIWWANLLARAKAGNLLHPRWLESGRPYLQQSLYEHVCQASSDAERHAVELQIERLFRLVPRVAEATALAEYEIISYAFIAGLRAPELRLSTAPGRRWDTLLTSVRRQNDLRAARALELTRQKNETLGQDKLTHWAERVGSGALGDVQVQELTRAQDLIAEGTIMTHCVGDGGYLQGCASGEYAVLSLQEPISHARATLQLVLNDGLGNRRIGQLAGPANSAVPQIFWKVARALAAGGTPERSLQNIERANLQKKAA